MCPLASGRQPQASKAKATQSEQRCWKGSLCVGASSPLVVAALRFTSASHPPTHTRAVPRALCPVYNADALICWIIARGRG